MLRKLIILTVAVMLALPMLPTEATANFRMGDTVFTLSGTGDSDNDFDVNTFAAQFSLSRFFTDGWEGIFRQDVGIVDGPDQTDWRGASSIAFDYNFNLQRFVPFVGASLGYIYGDSRTVDDTAFAGPEAGVKMFVNNTTFVQAIVQYQWFFDRMRDIDSNWDEGRFVYGLGMGVRW